MAITNLVPLADDLITLKEGVALLSTTGHPVSRATLKTWLAAHGTELVRRGRTDYVSASDVLVVHGAEVNARLNRSK